GRGGAAVGGHEGDLVVGVEAGHRVGRGGRPDGRGPARVGGVGAEPAEALLVPHVGGVLVGLAVEGERGGVVGEVAGGELVHLQGDLAEVVAVPAIAEHLGKVGAVPTIVPPTASTASIEMRARRTVCPLWLPPGNVKIRRRRPGSFYSAGTSTSARHWPRQAIRKGRKASVTQVLPTIWPRRKS